MFGGDKSSQSRDLRKAREFWKAYKEAQHGTAE